MSGGGTQIAKQSSVPNNATENKTKLRVLLLEDSSLDAELVLRQLRKDNFEVSAVVVQDEIRFAEALRNTVAREDSPDCSSAR